MCADRRGALLHEARAALQALQQWTMP